MKKKLIELDVDINPNMPLSDFITRLDNLKVTLYMESLLKILEDAGMKQVEWVNKNEKELKYDRVKFIYDGNEFTVETSISGNSLYLYYPKQDNRIVTGHTKIKTLLKKVITYI